VTRTLGAAAVALVLLAGITTDVSACGDNSLSAGGIRMQRALAARYPATVLIYAPAASRMAAAEQELNLQQTLQSVGHRYRQVSTSSQLESSLASGEFNVVLADVADLSVVQEQLESSPTRASLIAVAHNLTKTEAAEVAKVSRFMITAQSHAAQYLTTIADAVRSKGRTSRKA